MSCSCGAVGRLAVEPETSYGLSVTDTFCHTVHEAVPKAIRLLFVNIAPDSRPNPFYLQTEKKEEFSNITFSLIAQVLYQPDIT